MKIRVEIRDVEIIKNYFINNLEKLNKIILFYINIKSINNHIELKNTNWYFKINLNNNNELSNILKIIELSRNLIKENIDRILNNYNKLNENINFYNDEFKIYNKEKIAFNKYDYLDKMNYNSIDFYKILDYLIDFVKSKHKLKNILDYKNKLDYLINNIKEKESILFKDFYNFDLTLFNNFDNIINEFKNIIIDIIINLSKELNFINYEIKEYKNIEFIKEFIKIIKENKKINDLNKINDNFIYLKEYIFFKLDYFNLFYKNYVNNLNILEKYSEIIILKDNNDVEDNFREFGSSFSFILFNFNKILNNIYNYNDLLFIYFKKDNTLELIYEYINKINSIVIENHIFEPEIIENDNKVEYFFKNKNIIEILDLINNLDKAIIDFYNKLNDLNIKFINDLKKYMIIKDTIIDSNFNIKEEIHLILKTDKNLNIYNEIIINPFQIFNLSYSLKENLNKDKLNYDFIKNIENNLITYYKDIYEKINDQLIINLKFNLNSNNSSIIFMKSNKNDVNNANKLELDKLIMSIKCKIIEKTKIKVVIYLFEKYIIIKSKRYNLIIPLILIHSIVQFKEEINLLVEYEIIKFKFKNVNKSKFFFFIKNYLIQKNILLNYNKDYLYYYLESKEFIIDNYLNDCLNDKLNYIINCKDEIKNFVEKYFLNNYYEQNDELYPFYIYNIIDLIGGKNIEIINVPSDLINNKKFLDMENYSSKIPLEVKFKFENINISLILNYFIKKDQIDINFKFNFFETIQKETEIEFVFEIWKIYKVWKDNDSEIENCVLMELFLKESCNFFKNNYDNMFLKTIEVFFINFIKKLILNFN